jgi:CxxC motif-containing protein
MRALSVTAAFPRNVGYLKKEINEENFVTLAAVDAKDVELYHVNLKYDDSDEQRRISQANKVLQSLSKQTP